MIFDEATTHTIIIPTLDAYAFESGFLIFRLLNCSIITIRSYMCTIKCYILGVNVWRINNGCYTFAIEIQGDRSDFEQTQPDPLRTNADIDRKNLDS